MFPTLLPSAINSSHLIRIQVVVAAGAFLLHYVPSIIPVKFVDIKIILLLSVNVGLIITLLLILLLGLVRLILSLVTPINIAIHYSICKHNSHC